MPYPANTGGDEPAVNVEAAVAIVLNVRFRNQVLVSIASGNRSCQAGVRTFIYYFNYDLVNIAAGRDDGFGLRASATVYIAHVSINRFSVATVCQETDGRSSSVNYVPFVLETNIIDPGVVVGVGVAVKENFNATRCSRSSAIKLVEVVTSVAGNVLTMFADGGSVGAEETNG